MTQVTTMICDCCGRKMLMPYWRLFKNAMHPEVYDICDQCAQGFLKHIKSDAS